MPTQISTQLQGIHFNVQMLAKLSGIYDIGRFRELPGSDSVNLYTERCRYKLDSDNDLSQPFQRRLSNHLNGILILNQKLFEYGVRKYVLFLSLDAREGTSIDIDSENIKLISFLEMDIGITIC